MSQAAYEMWAWLELTDGKWGVLCAIVPQVPLGPIPLQTRHKSVAERQFGPIAAAHEKKSGHAVRLALLREVAT